MSKRILSLALSGFLFILLLNWSCTKIDTTTIGSDLLPAVDNINTFADTLSINTTQGVFLDTTKLTVSNTAENYVFGKTNDPLFGGTEAKLYLQLKPGFYPYYFGSPGDTIQMIDSVVLCLGYKGVYGDTLTPMRLDVNAVSFAAHGEWDSLGTYENPSLRDIRYAPAISDLLTDISAVVDLPSIRTYHTIGKGKDSVINQIRIRLSDDFADHLFQQDSAYGGGFSRDTLFRNRVNNGFAISMTNGNALLYTQLSDRYTRLEVHFKRKVSGTSLRDTSMSTFTFNNGISGSAAPSRGAVADNIVRTRGALPNPGDQEIYLQTSPGTYASLKIPQLSGYSNRIVHRAEILVEQIPSDPVTDGYFSEPGYLYLDLVDSVGTDRWKTIYYDLNPSYAYDPDHGSGSSTLLDYFPFNRQVDYTYFGGIPFNKADASSATGLRKAYTINITRYVQRICTRGGYNYEMRLYAPYNIIYPQYTPIVIPYSNTIAQGRVRVGGGSCTDPKYRMRLRIIYSKLN